MNILEILKKCPKGTKLYSPIFGECTLNNIISNDTFSVIGNDYARYVFFYDGRYTRDGECCIFPSKKERDWTRYQIFNTYKNGDIIHFISKTDRKYIYIFKNIKDNMLCGYIGLFTGNNSGFLNTYFDINNIKEHRLATQKEKETLFKLMENDGYRWNKRTKTIDKLIKDKFNITTFKPFDKVLVRNEDDEEWRINFFERYINKCFITITEVYTQCIPFEPNKHLHKTDEKCDNYYITW